MLFYFAILSMQFITGKEMEKLQNESSKGRCIRLQEAGDEESEAVAKSKQF